MASGNVECKAVPGLEGASIVRTFQSLEELARHAHRSLIISLVLQGRRRVRLGNRTLVAGPGSVMTVAPGAVHACTAQAPLDSLTLCLPASCLEHPGVYLWAHSGVCLFHDPGLLELTTAAWVSLDCSRKDDPQSAPLQRLLVRLAAAEPLVRLTTTEPEARNIPAGVRRARTKLDHCPDMDGRELARLANMSAWGLSRAFARAYGLPPHSYGMLRRVDRAKSLLARGLPAAQVAAETGFADQSHLTRRFKRLVGLTPGRYAQAFADAGRAGT